MTTRTEEIVSVNKKIHITSDDFMFVKSGEYRKFIMDGKDIMRDLRGVQFVHITMHGDGAFALIEYDEKEPVDVDG